MTETAPTGARGWLVAGAIALGVVVTLVIVGMVLHPPAPPPDHTVAGPVAGRSELTFELLTGATSVRVVAADLGGDAYRIATPRDGRFVPHVDDRDGVVRLDLADSGTGGGASAVDIRLSPAVTWHLRLVAGATEERLDLSAGRVAGVELVGGASSVDLALPRPRGNTAVRLAGGAGSVAVHLPDAVPARLELDSGAGGVTVDGQRRGGVSAGSVVEPDGWAAAADRYTVTAVAGVADLTVDRR